jgi:AcrR family transcriptional regulator
MKISASTPRPQRRTQAERRAATRTALLEATIECLARDGYARTTTRGISERAGVTPGAQQHHFPNKAALMSAALGHLARKLVDELLATGLPKTTSPTELVEQMLDRVWEIHNGPLFQATMELWIAARTDPELRSSLADVQREVASRGALARAHMFPEAVRHPGFAQCVATALAAIRGLALLAFLNDTSPAEQWPATRAHLTLLFAQLVEETSSR